MPRGFVFVAPACLEDVADGQMLWLDLAGCASTFRRRLFPHDVCPDGGPIEMLGTVFGMLLLNVFLWITLRVHDAKLLVRMRVRGCVRIEML